MHFFLFSSLLLFLDLYFLILLWKSFFIIPVLFKWWYFGTFLSSSICHRSINLCQYLPQAVQVRLYYNFTLGDFPSSIDILLFIACSFSNITQRDFHKYSNKFRYFYCRSIILLEFFTMVWYSLGNFDRVLFAISESSICMWGFSTSNLSSLRLVIQYLNFIVTSYGSYLENFLCVIVLEGPCSWINFAWKFHQCLSCISILIKFHIHFFSD